MRKLLGLGAVALLVIGALGYVSSVFAVDAPGEHSACVTVAVTATTPDHIIGVDGSPVSTIPGDTQSASDSACVTATDQTVTGPTTTETVHDTVTETQTVTVTAPPPPPPPPPPPAQFSGTFDCYGSTPNCTAAPAMCTTMISSGISAAVSAATAGSVICLTSGTYPATTLSSVSKSSDVTVRPADGATVTLGTTTLSGTTSHVRFSGTGGTMNMAGAHFASGNANDTLDHIVFTNCVDVSMGTSTSGLLLDHDRFDGLGKGIGLAICNSESEGRVQTTGDESRTSVAFTVSNSHFGGGGCSDGIQVESAGVQFGPGNEINGIVQGNCSNIGGYNVHADPVQCVGAPNLIVTGNYFHDNSTTFMCGAGFTNFHEQNIRVRNNVFGTNTGYWSMHLAGQQNDLIEHNVALTNTCFGTQNGNNPIADVLRNNVWIASASPGINMTGCEDRSTVCSGACSNTYNLNAGNQLVAGLGSLSGTEVFVSSPASGYYHYELSPSSPGYHAASDGKSMGICSGCG